MALDRFKFGNKDLSELSWGDIADIAKGDKGKLLKLTKQKYLDDEKARQKLAETEKNKTPEKISKVESYSHGIEKTKVTNIVNKRVVPMVKNWFKNQGVDLNNMKIGFHNGVEIDQNLNKTGGYAAVILSGKQSHTLLLSKEILDSIKNYTPLSGENANLDSYIVLQALLHEVLHTMFTSDNINYINGSGLVDNGRPISIKHREGIVQYFTYIILVDSIKSDSTILPNNKTTILHHYKTHFAYKEYVEALTQNLSDLAHKLTLTPTNKNNKGNYLHNRKYIDQLLINYFIKNDQTILELAKLLKVQPIKNL